MSDLAAGTRVLAADWPTALYAADATSISNITATTYQVGSPAVGGQFVAPTTGRVLIGVGGQGRGPGDRPVITPQVYEGADATGTLVLPANLNERACVLPDGSASSAYQRITLLDGLTPGALHFARALYRVIPVAGGTIAGTADIFNREIWVVPVP